MKPIKLCASCNKPASVFQSHSGRFLCRACFIRYVERQIRKTISKYNLIENEDLICIGVSGGKDSLVMLYNLYQSQLGIKNAAKIIVIWIDEGIIGYRQESENNLLSFMNKFKIDVDLVKLSFRKNFGMTLDEMVEIIRKENLKLNPCSVCGTIRRRLLNDAAINIKATKLAIGHNLDDTIQTLVLNLLRNDLRKVRSVKPHTSKSNPILDVGKEFIQRIKPLIRLTDEEISLYCYFMDIPFQSNPCLYSEAFPILRRDVQSFINAISSHSHEIKYNLLKVNYELIELLRSSKNITENFGRCKICHQLTGPKRDICLYCEYKALFGLSNCI
jgi:uncharacterized protein (TIGR00269 family)